MASDKKYYAVKKGLTPGIYRTWDECKVNVMGYPGAIYKSFTTEEEAVAFINGVVVQKENKEVEKVKHTANGPIAYVDGSCNAEGTRYSYGVVILNGDKEIHLSGVGNDPEIISMRNVAGEILGSQSAMEYALEHGMKEITIYHDYQGISSWPKGEWKCNKEGTKNYKEKYQEISKYVNIDFVKIKGHSNTFYNDVVDALAKNALGIESGIKKNIAEHIESIRKKNEESPHDATQNESSLCF